MFQTGKTYRHLTSKDVSYVVSKVQYRGERYWKVRVFYQTPYSVFGPETVKIQRQDFWKWREVSVG